MRLGWGSVIGIAALFAAAPLAAESIGLQVKEVVATYDPLTMRKVLNIRLMPGASADLAEFTATRIGKEVVLRLDDLVLTRPTLRDVITGGNLQVSGIGVEDAGQGLSIDEIAGKLREAGVLTLSDE